MTDSTEDLAAVEQLLTESEALRGWLTRLDQAPGSPTPVRERVRSDYQRRLDEVTGRLGSHADVVETKLRDDRAEHAGLSARATEAREALAEAELRHAVGEYDADRFQGEQHRFSSDIESYDLALAAVAERIHKLEQVHALMHREPMGSTTGAAASTAEAPAGAKAPESAPIAIEALAPDSDPALAVFEDPFDESAQGGAKGGTGVSAPAEKGPLSFRPSGSGEPLRTVAAPPAQPRPFESAPPLGIPTADVPPRFVRPGERLSAPPPPPPPAVAPAKEAPQREVAPPAPASAGSGNDGAGPAVARTLRCGECGAMNRPLEWYCEKCGAELTAV